MSALTVGCFEVREVEPGKWFVKNTLTGFEHHTYGTQDEIVPLLEAQTEAWKARKATLEGKRGRLRVSMGKSIAAARANTGEAKAFALKTIPPPMDWVRKS